MGNLRVSSRLKRPLVWIGVPVLLLALLVAFWQWDWFIPLVQSRASAAIGRPVMIGHLHVRLSRVVQVTVTDLVVTSPPEWPKEEPPLASIKTLTVQADAWAYIRGQGLVLPLIDIDTPKIYAAETADGSANFRLSTGDSSGGAPPKIGDLRINHGEARVLLPRLKADFRVKIATADEGEAARVVVDAEGTYAAQPITGHLVGGALLSLRDAAHPWPIDLTVANGPTHVALKGTLQDPVALKGADVTLRLSGPDLERLEHLVGFPIPKTPSYDISGKLDFEGLQKVKFTNFHGRLGNTDIAGSMAEQPSGTEAKGKTKPVVTMDLRSDRVDLVDLNGFIGGQPGRSTTAGATPQQREEVAKANARSRLLPDTPIDVPRLDWADIHLRYHGAHIEGRSIPFDDLTVALDIVDSRITVHPVSFGVGKGRLLANVDLTPASGRTVRAKADLHLQNLDLARMMAATQIFQGAGSISGVGAIDATGDSLAALLATGNGGVKMAMAGGDLSAILVDLTGLQFGNALLSALGVPQKTPVQCFVGDLGLHQGILNFNAMTLETGEGITNVGGNVDLRSEKIDLALKTDAKHFSVGSLPTRLTIGGTFKDPSIRPGAEIAARAGAVAGLAALFAPLGILPTIQLGTTEQEDARCGDLLRQARASAAGPELPRSPAAAGGNPPAATPQK